MEEVKALLGMTGYLRKFVPRYSALVAPISNLLRDKRFATKRARKLKVPWGKEQDKALAALILALTSPPGTESLALVMLFCVCMHRLYASLAYLSYMLGMYVRQASC